jgi:MFS family permease
MAAVSEPEGWRPLQKPQRAANVGLAPGPFARLARMHSFSAAADGLVTVALAGSIFFSIEPDAARWRVALYLLLTIAPFAVVTPLIGPAIDRTRGGRRGMIVGTAFARALVAFLMVSNIESILLFPLAFALLVLQKAYSVAKSAVVPKLVGSEQKLVEANSKLALLSSLAGMAGAAVGALLSVIAGPAAAAGCAVLLYIAAGLAGLKLPRVVVAEAPAEELERAELRGSGIVMAATGMGVMRGVVGFMTFLLAFELRGGKDGVDVKPLGAAAGAATAVARDIDIQGDPGAPAWHFGAVVVAAGVGALLGARIAPELRRWVHEERILLGAFAATAVAGLAAMWFGGLTGAMLLSLAVALAAGSGKLAFDSLVQRDAPDANYGRSFSRFEARFQLTWVLGAAVPVVLPLPERLGFFLVAVAAAFAAITYYLNTRNVPEGPSPALTSGDAMDSTVVLESSAVDVTTRFDADPSGDTERYEAAPSPEDANAGHDPGAPPSPSPSPSLPPPPLPPPPPPPAPTQGWGDAPIAPTVTSVEGVEVEPVHEPRDVDAGARPNGAARDD